MNHLQKAFEEAKKAYPDCYISGYKKMWDSLFDDEEPEEVEIAHRWQLVDAVAASFYTPEREGKLLLQEYRPGCRVPFNHWGFMVDKSEVTR